MLRMLGAQPGPDTTSRMALLPRRSLVLLQDRVDELAYFLKLRTRTLRDFTLRRYRALQRLTHHPTVYSELLRHSLYRSYSVLVLATDLLEQSHFRTPFQPTLLSGFFPGSGYRSRWGGPNQMSEMGQFRLANTLEHYRYREELFPTTQFRMAYDRLHQHFTSSRAIKDYLRILQYAARLSESAVDTVLGWLIRGGELPTLGAVEALLQLSETPPLEDVHIDEVELTAYDHLLDGEEEVVQC